MSFSELLQLDNAIVEIVRPEDKRRQDHGQGISRSRMPRFGEQRQLFGTESENPAQRMRSNSAAHTAGTGNPTGSPLPIPCRADMSASKRGGTGDIFDQFAAITIPYRPVKAMRGVVRGAIIKLRDALHGSECYWWEIDSVTVNKPMFKGDGGGTIEITARERQVDWEPTA